MGYLVFTRFVEIIALKLKIPPSHGKNYLL
jgi:hypothetical protein